jgi:hypothetical protein
MDKVKVIIKLEGTAQNPSGSLEYVDEPGQYVFEGINGTSWQPSVDPDTTFLFICEASGDPGPFGPITVTDGDGNALREPKMCQIRSNHTGTCTVQFVSPPAAAAAGADSQESGQ